MKTIITLTLLLCSIGAMGKQKIDSVIVDSTGKQIAIAKVGDVENLKGKYQRTKGEDGREWVRFGTKKGWSEWYRLYNSTLSINAAPITGSGGGISAGKLDYTLPLTVTPKEIIK